MDLPPFILGRFVSFVLQRRLLLSLVQRVVEFSPTFRFKTFFCCTVSRIMGRYLWIPVSQVLMIITIEILVKSFGLSPSYS